MISVKLTTGLRKGLGHMQMRPRGTPLQWLAGFNCGLGLGVDQSKLYDINDMSTVVSNTWYVVIYPVMRVG